MQSSVDPAVLAIVGYLAVSFGADRSLQAARVQLTSDEKLRLMDGFASLWSVAYAPTVGWAVLLGVGLVAWPHCAFEISYAALVGITGGTMLLSWRRLRAIGVNEAYVRVWRLSRSLKLMAMVGLLSYLAWYYASWGR